MGPRYRHELHVRYADVDMQGHVFFANYFTFCDEALTGYLHAIGCAPPAIADIGVDFVYADARCSYAGSAKWEDRLEIAVRPSRVGRTSITWALGIHRGPGPEEPIVRAQLVTVLVDAVSLRPVPIPELLREAIARYEDQDA